MTRALALTNRDKHITKLTAADIGYPEGKLTFVSRLDDFTVAYELTVPWDDFVFTAIVNDVGGQFTVTY
jgi:hypothetical protein